MSFVARRRSLIRGEARVLVSRGAISPLLTLLRAQAAGVRATALGADGVTWGTFAANAARFHGINRRLLIGPQATNGLRNPDAEGLLAGVVGAGGLLGTNWSAGVAGGHTVTVIGPASINGLAGVEVQLSSTGVAATTTIHFEAASAVALVASASYSVQLHAQLTSGGWTNVSGCGIRGRTDAATGTNHPAYSLLGIPTTQLGRVSGSYVTPANATAGRMQLIWTTTAAGAASTRLALCAPQMERGAYPTTPVRPPVGAPAASTRGADLITGVAPLLFPFGGTVLFGVMVPQAAPVGQDQTVFQVDDGTDSNALRLRNAAGGLTVLPSRVLGGVSADGPVAGSLGAGQLLRGAASFGNGRLAVSLEGGVPQAVAGGPTGGFTVFRLGNTAAGTAALAGECGWLSALPYPVPDAALPGLAASIPL